MAIHTMITAKHRQIITKKIIVTSFSWVLLLKCKVLFLQGFFYAHSGLKTRKEGRYILIQHQSEKIRR